MTSLWILLMAALAAGGCSRSDDTWLYRDDTEHHLGAAGQPEWQEFAGRTPEGRQLDLLFSAETNPADDALSPAGERQAPMGRQPERRVAWPRGFSAFVATLE